MIPRKKKRAREYMANPAANAQHHDSMDFTAPSSTKVLRGYEARSMIGSISVRSISGLREKWTQINVKWFISTN